jgi:hypothetical protein
MMIPLRDNLFINSDFIESYSRDEGFRSINMVSGQTFKVTAMELQTVINVLQNTARIESQVAY